MRFDDYAVQNRPKLMRFATVLTGQAWLADDIVSDVLGRAYERWERIGGLDQPHAYVRRMIVNDYVSWRRRRARTWPVAQAGLDVSEPDSTDVHAERAAMIARLNRLPRRRRAAVVLRYYVGLSDAEIAEELSCSESTVRSQISRALHTLRLDIDRREPVDREPERSR